MEKLGIYGIGTIGSAQVTLASGNGFAITGIGLDEADIERAWARIAQNWDDMIAKGLATEANKKAAMVLVTLTTDVAALKDCTYVIEAVLESLDIKKKVYGEIEAVTGADTIIASTTSSINAEDLAACASRPENLLIAHPFQPVHLQPLVEIVSHPQTRPEVVKRTADILTALKRQVVTLKKSAPGFLVNRLAQTLFRESIYMIEEGITTAEDIDRAVKYAVGMRYAEIGLLEYFDAVGFDLESAIATNVYPDLADTKEVQKTVRDGLAAGKKGLNDGQGLLDWSKKDVNDYRRRLQEPFFACVKEWDLPG